MAYRRPSRYGENPGSPSLGFRLSSNRQPGIREANNSMPQYGGPPSRSFSRQGIEQLPNMYYQNMGGQSSSDRRDRYIANTQGGHPSMSQYGYPMQFHSEQAAVDPSDRKTLETILGAGGNPDDYVQMAMGPDDYPMFPSGPGIRGPRLKYEPEVQELDLFDMMEGDTFLPDFDQDEYYSSGIMGAMPGEYETAGIYQTWKKISGKFGEAYANNWLAQQQAV